MRSENGHVLPPDTITVPVPKPEPPQTPTEPRSDAPNGATSPSQPPTREPLTFERGDPSALQRPTKGDLVKAAAVQGVKEIALSVVDPLHVNRNFISDIITLIDDSASDTNRGIAGAGVVLSVIPMAGELRLAPGALVRVLTVSRSSEELAHAVLSLGRGGQTVAILETAEGVRLVGGGVKDLSPLQRIYSSILGLVPTKLAGVHAEGTVIEGAASKGLTPLKGVATSNICWVCERDLTEGAFGTVFELSGERAFIAR